MAADIIQEPGFWGNNLQSLGGIIGAPGRGRQLLCDGNTYTTTVGIVLPNNPKRIAAYITNTGADSCKLKFGDSNNAVVPLLPGDSFQIDSLFPWCGAVYVLADTATCTILFAEVSVP